MINLKVLIAKGLCLSRYSEIFVFGKSVISVTDVLLSAVMRKLFYSMSMHLFVAQLLGLCLLLHLYCTGSVCSEQIL